MKYIVMQIAPRHFISVVSKKKKTQRKKNKYSICSKKWNARKTEKYQNLENIKEIIMHFTSKYVNISGFVQRIEKFAKIIIFS